ncbi:hypothetical protein LOK49_LG02G03927 [Camellia lanceoleosa]|uniref:Uncharacterized protein n=1 Tax=Camellia lanceoleosa TaxID=1840588 RepID=A0ACC0ILZ5_9ERIC|nr:hypothetical protein LOK49_LG02G03927 [Camellia lanceoleosa]
MGTGIAWSTGLPVEHYRRQVDDLQARLRPLLHRSSGPPTAVATTAAREQGWVEDDGITTQGSVPGSSVRPTDYASEGDAEIVGAEDAIKDKKDILPNSPGDFQSVGLAPPKVSILSLVSGPWSVGQTIVGGDNTLIGPKAYVAPRYFVTEPQDNPTPSSPRLVLTHTISSPIGIEEISPSSSPPRLDLKTIMLDECISTVFNSLSLKRKAQPNSECSGRQTKLIKGTELQKLPCRTVNTSSTSSRKPQNVRNSLGRGRGTKKGRRGHQDEVSELYDVNVSIDSTLSDGTQSGFALNTSTSEFDECCTQVPNLHDEIYDREDHPNGDNDTLAEENMQVDFTKLTERQKKMFELRLKMNEARKANQTAMVAEKKRMEAPPESKGS